METELLSPELLDRVWWRWLADYDVGSDEYWISYIQHTIQYKTSYAGEKRGRRMSIDFEHWLFDQGAAIKQINGKRYLEFSDAASATMFTIRWL